MNPVTKQALWHQVFLVIAKGSLALGKSLSAPAEVAGTSQQWIRLLFLPTDRFLSQ